MSKVCSVCGKGKLSGNLVSHSNRKTPRLYNANVQKVRVVNDGVVSSDIDILPYALLVLTAIIFSLL